MREVWFLIFDFQFLTSRWQLNIDKIYYSKFNSGGGETEFEHKGEAPQKMSLPLDCHLNLSHTFFPIENERLHTWYGEIHNVHAPTKKKKKNRNFVHNILSCSCKNEGLIKDIIIVHLYTVETTLASIHGIFNNFLNYYHPIFSTCDKLYTMVPRLWQVFMAYSTTFLTTII